MIKLKIAKAARILTIPPLLVCSLLLFLFFTRSDVFSGIPQLFFSLLFLMGIPILAYPLSLFLPHYKKNGRDGQRNLAFIMNIAGYSLAVPYGIITHCSKPLMLIFWTYWLSVVFLLIFNKLIKLRASGHACSVAGPLILAGYFTGWISIFPCAMLFALVVWSSLVLKRHTPMELLTGGLTALVSFALGLVIIFL